MVTSRSRRSGTLIARLRRRLAASDARGWPRAGWHVLLAIAIFMFIATLEDRGMAWRRAAQHGDPEARHLRRVVAQALHHVDALSVLEHAMTGFGTAVIGVVALQLYYAKLALEVSHEPQPVGPFGRAVALLVAGAVGVGMGNVSYAGTRIMVGVIVASAVWGTFVFRDAWCRLAWSDPQWNIGWVGGVMWVVVDVVWKIYHAAVTRDSWVIVTAQLVAGFVLLVVTAWAAGRLMRRMGGLRPIAMGGR